MAQQQIKSLPQATNLLKKRRKKLGISQTELAQYCNLSRSGISLIELGEKDIRLTTLLKICKILGVEMTLELDD